MRQAGKESRKALLEIFERRDSGNIGSGGHQDRGNIGSGGHQDRGNIGSGGHQDSGNHGVHHTSQGEPIVLILS